MKLSARFIGLAAFFLVVGYALFALRGAHGVSGLMEKRRQIEQLEKRNAALQQEIQQRQEHVRRLTDDPGEQELEIRQRLKLVKPGEKIYVLSK
jgi:cell division protein FtsB